MKLTCIALALSLLAGSAWAEEKTVGLGELGIQHARIGWGKLQKDKSVDGNPLKIAGQEFKTGIGTHASSRIDLDLKKAALRFEAMVGVDAETADKGSVEFLVKSGKKTLWTSGIMKGNDPAKKASVDLTGLEAVSLVVSDGNDGVDYDHADWADAKIIYDGTAPTEKAVALANKDRIILTPAAAPQPRINGPGVFGIRPGSPFLFTIAAAGERPMTYAAEGLPEGLKFDDATGRITGTIASQDKKTYAVTFKAKNGKGEATRAFKIVVGDEIGLTPPMGWNSWNCWGPRVDADKVRASAQAMIDAGLAQHGWTYINIDDCWQGARTGENKALQANQKFPDMKKLGDDIHAMGLKFGIYSTPWCMSYAGYCGGSSDNEDGSFVKGHKHGKVKFDHADAKQWAAWGVDYLKYDWHVNDAESTIRMAKALKGSGRDIIYSLSNSGPMAMAKVFDENVNCWRTTGDIRDDWNNVTGIWKGHRKWQAMARPGHFPDPDMLVVGNVFGWNGNPKPSNLTPWEQYSHISAWCLWSAPLLIGCPLEQLDPFTQNLLTNDEVLAIDQDTLGVMAKSVVNETDREIMVKPLEDGSIAVGLFNHSDEAQTIVADWATLGVTGKQTVRDLWRQKDLATLDGKFETEVPEHGVVLIKLTPAK